MATKKQTDWQGMLEEWFGKLPPLSKNARQTLVNITPWIALIFGILGVLGSLAGFGVLTAFTPFMAMSAGLGGATSVIISAALGLIASVLLLVAYPGTKAKKSKGWQMLFWSEVVNLLSAVLSFSPVGVLINLVGFYLLFQIKSYYK